MGVTSEAGDLEPRLVRQMWQHGIPPGSAASTASLDAASRLTRREMGRRTKLKRFLMRNGFSTVHAARCKFSIVSYPLHVAVKRFDVEMVELLLEHGADPLKTNSWGETPEEYAVRKGRHGDPEVVDVIILLLAEATDDWQWASDEEDDAGTSENPWCL